MDRYYKILGISNNASKEEIKLAYYRKMKALHPDKVHGTPLEDTATFFSTEINEAYNALISQFKKKQNSTSKYEYIEEDLCIEGIGLCEYTLSNDFDVIINAITKRTGYTIPGGIDSLEWILNTELSEKVKKSMNKHNMNYSMTTYFDRSVQYFVINNRYGGNWYFTGYGINTGYSANQTSSYYDYGDSKQYYSSSIVPKKKSRAKKGFFMGLLNMIHLFAVYMNKQNINLPIKEKTTIIFVWAIVTLILAIIGFSLSVKGLSGEKNNKGFGVLGAALNGIIIFPAFLFILSALPSSKNKS